MLQAFWMRRARVSACFAVVIHRIQSRRAIGVMSVHSAFGSCAVDGATSQVVTVSPSNLETTD